MWSCLLKLARSIENSIENCMFLIWQAAIAGFDFYCCSEVLFSQWAKILSYIDKADLWWIEMLCLHQQERCLSTSMRYADSNSADWIFFFTWISSDYSEKKMVSELGPVPQKNKANPWIYCTLSLAVYDWTSIWVQVICVWCLRWKIIHLKVGLCQKSQSQLQIFVFSPVSCDVAVIVVRWCRQWHFPACA